MFLRARRTRELRHAIRYVEVGFGMERHWKTVAVILAALVCASLAGCGNPKKGSSALSIGGDVMYRDLPPVTISMYFPGTKPKDWDAVRTEIEKRIFPTMKTKLDFQWFELRDYVQKINVLSASGEAFDAFCCGKPQQNYPDFTKLARNGQIKDIGGLFLEKAPSLYGKYTQQELGYGKVDGKQYAIPSLYPHAYCTYIMVDDALLTRFGIQSIATYGEYEAFLKAVKNHDPALVPGVIANGIDTLSLFSRGAGYVILDEIQKLVYRWDDPQMRIVPWEKTTEFRTVADTLVSWHAKGYLSSEPDQSRTSSFVYFGKLQPPRQGTTKMTFSSSDSKEIKESNPLRVFYLYPDNVVQRDNPMGRFFFNGSFVFPSTSRHTDRTLMFLDWVQQSRGNYFLMMYGIENRNHVMRNGYPVLPEGMNYRDRTYMYWDGYWAFQNPEHIAGPAVDPKGTRVDEKGFLDEYSRYPPHGAFYPDFKSMESAADRRAKAFSAFENKLYRGQVKDATAIGEFLREIEGSGSANIVELAQEQLDGFRKR